MFRWLRFWKLSPLQATVVGASLGALVLILYFGSCQLRAWLLFRAAQRALREAEQAQYEHKLGQALENLDRYLECRPDSAAAQLLAARTARRLFAYDRSRDYLGEAEKLGADAESIALEKDLLRAQQGEVSSVERRLKYLVDNDHPDTVLILEAMVPGYMKTFQYPRAFACLELWLQLQTDNVHALIQHGQVCRRLDRYPEALAVYRRAISLDPIDDNAKQELAELLLFGNETTEAGGIFEDLLERKPRDSVLVLGLVRCCMHIGEFDKARLVLDDFLQHAPTHGQALAQRGKIALETGANEEAERFLRKAVEQDPYDREYLYPLYLCLHRQQKEEEAVKLLARFKQIEADMSRLKEITRGVMLQPHDPQLRTEAGAILLRNGQRDGGITWLLSALHEDPNYAPARQELVDYYERIGELEVAARHRQLLRSSR